MVVEVGYFYNRLVNNWRSIDGNPAPPGPGNLNRRRLYQTTAVPPTGDVITLANVTRIQKDGWSQYHGLQTKFEKRYSKGISLLAAYTWSKTRGLEGGYQDYTNIDAEVGADRPPIARTTSLGAACTSCRSVTTDRLAVIGVALRTRCLAGGASVPSSR